MYCKLFASLYQGTLRGRSHEILVFTNLMAHASKDGYVDKHFRAIAEETGLTIDEVKAAIVTLESPDEESRSPAANGARLRRMEDRPMNQTSKLIEPWREHIKRAAEKAQQPEAASAQPAAVQPAAPEAPAAQPQAATAAEGDGGDAQREQATAHGLFRRAARRTEAQLQRRIVDLFAEQASLVQVDLEGLLPAGSESEHEFASAAAA